MARLWVCPQLWLSPPLLRPSRRSVWQKESFYAWVLGSRRLFSWLRFCFKYFPFPSPPFHLLFLPSDEITINVLRGIQGCGAAATIPACVRPYRHTTVFTMNQFPTLSSVYWPTHSLPPRRGPLRSLLSLPVPPLALLLETPLVPFSPNFPSQCFFQYLCVFC